MAGKNFANLDDCEEKKNFGIIIIVPLLLLHLLQHTYLLRAFEWKLNSSTLHVCVALSSCQALFNSIEENDTFSFKLPLGTGNTGDFFGHDKNISTSLPSL